MSRQSRTVVPIHLDLWRYGLFTLLMFVAPARAEVPELPFKIVHVFPHDRHAFTEGLTIDRGRLFESVGRKGHSDVRQVDLVTSRAMRRRRLSNLFGEGLAVWNRLLVQLTWRDKRAYFYDPTTLNRRGEIQWPGEGWGAAGDQGLLLTSDGSARLRWTDPTNGKIKKTMTVTSGGHPLSGLNELEIYKGKILADVWPTPIIVMIDPANGLVLATVNLSRLVAREAHSHPPVDVLNGIAYDPGQDRLFVTGKLWSHLYEIRLPR